MSKLELSIKNKSISDDDLLYDLKLVAKNLNKSPTINEYNCNGKYESTVYIRRFGSWNKALFKINLPANNTIWTEKDLIDNFNNVWVSLNRQPRRRDMDNKLLSRISSGAYCRFYHSWTGALKNCTEAINESGMAEHFVQKSTYIRHKTSRDINLRLRFKVLKRDNFCCCVCGRSPSTTKGLELHIDHIIPYSKGGETVIDNLQTLCSDCNLGKGNLL